MKKSILITLTAIIALTIVFLTGYKLGSDNTQKSNFETIISLQSDRSEYQESLNICQGEYASLAYQFNDLSYWHDLQSAMLDELHVSLYEDGSYTIYYQDNASFSSCLDNSICE